MVYCQNQKTTQNQDIQDNEDIESIGETEDILGYPGEETGELVPG